MDVHRLIKNYDASIDHGGRGGSRNDSTARAVPRARSIVAQGTELT
jgi:hypothetical protein